MLLSCNTLSCTTCSLHVHCICVHITIYTIHFTVITCKVGGLEPSARLVSRKVHDCSKMLMKTWWLVKKFNHVYKLVNLVFVNDQAILVFCVLCTLTILGKLLGFT